MQSSIFHTARKISSLIVLITVVLSNVAPVYASGGANSIYGFVYGPDGTTGLENVSVMFYDTLADPDAALSVLTNAVGQYSITGIGVGNYMLSVSIDNTTVAPNNVIVTISGADGYQNFYTKPLYSISGKVKDAQGTNLPNAVAHYALSNVKTDSTGHFVFPLTFLTDPGSQTPLGGATVAIGNRNVMTNPNGSFAISGYVLDQDSASVKNVGVTFSVDNITNPTGVFTVSGSVDYSGTSGPVSVFFDGNPTNYAYTDNTFGFSGTVTKNSTPQAGVAIVYSEGSYTTDSNGNYSFSSLMPGHYTLTANYHTFDPASLGADLVNVSLFDQDLIFAMSIQSITFTSSVPGNAVVGGPTYTPTATGGGSDNPVEFTIDAASSSVCSIAGGEVSFHEVGNCVIDANQLGSGSYEAAPQVQLSFPVGKGSQAITYTSIAPSTTVVGGPTYTPTATGGTSGNPVVFTIAAASSSVCSIALGVVSFQGAGTCTINANQAGDTNYNAAPQVQQQFSVSKIDQVITFTSTMPSDAVVGGPSYTPTATGGDSGNPLVFTIDPTASSICALNLGMVSFQATGTCTINANQAGDTIYNAAAQVQQSFSVGKGSQAIVFTATAPTSADVGGPTYTPTATGGASGNPVIFTIAAASSSICAINSGVVSFQSAGTCTINANQSGDANYNAAPQEQQSFPVGKGSQTITFTSTVPTDATINGPTYTPTATGGASSIPVTFTIAATSSSVCSIALGVVSFQATGTCTINANQAGDANYNAAPQVQQQFSVRMIDQEITFTSSAPINAVVDGPTYTPTATGGASGNPVVFTIDPTASSVCVINLGVVSFHGAGACIVNANQAGDGTYVAADLVQQIFNVGKGDQTITFTSTAPSNAVIDGATYIPTATGGASGKPVVFTIAAASSSVCSITLGVVSFQSAGACTIDANQAGNANYNDASQVQQEFPVGKIDQTIILNSDVPMDAVVGGPTYTPTATGGASGNPVVFSIAASSSSVCSISAGMVSFQGVGTCTIDANQAGDGTYNAAVQVQQSFSVGKGSQTITFTSTAPLDAVVGGATYQPTATGGASPNLVVFTIAASSSSVCSIAAGVVSFHGAGTCTINANQAGDGTYNAAAQIQQDVMVGKGSQTLAFTSTAPTSAYVGGPTYTPTATGGGSTSPVVFTIAASSSSVCAITAGVVSFQGVGTCTIDANQAGDGNYNSAPQVQQTFTVSAAPPTSFTISGTTGVAGTTLSWNDGTDKTFTTLTGGAFTITVTNGWAGKLTPSMIGYNFSPAEKNFASTPVTANVTGVNFIPSNNQADRDATLSGIGFTLGSLDNQFSPNTTGYNVTLATEITALDVIPTASQSGATITINGTSVNSGDPLNVTLDSDGLTTLSILVKARFVSSTKTYTVNIIQPPNTAALRIVSNHKDEAFTGMLYSYTVVIKNDYHYNLTYSVNTGSKDKPLPDWLDWKINDDGSVTFYGTPDLADLSTPVIGVNIDVTDEFGLTVNQTFNIHLTMPMKNYLPLTLRSQ